MARVTYVDYPVQSLNEKNDRPQWSKTYNANIPLEDNDFRYWLEVGLVYRNTYMYFRKPR